MKFIWTHSYFSVAPQLTGALACMSCCGGHTAGLNVSCSFLQLCSVGYCVWQGPWHYYTTSQHPGPQHWRGWWVRVTLFFKGLQVLVQGMDQDDVVGISVAKNCYSQYLTMSVKCWGGICGFYPARIVWPGFSLGLTEHWRCCHCWYVMRSHISGSWPDTASTYCQQSIITPVCSKLEVHRQGANYITLARTAIGSYANKCFSDHFSDVSSICN